MTIYLLILTSLFFILIRLFIQPFLIGIITLLLALVISLIIAILLRPWYGFIIMLIYVGGMLVIFFYIITISSNAIFNFIKLKDILIIRLITSTVIISTKITLPLSTLLWTSNSVKHTVILSVSSIIALNNLILYIILIMLLLVVIITVVKLCFKKRGSIRSFKTYAKLMTKKEYHNKIY